MNMTTEACVARGAEFLDAVAPGWEGRIDLSTLALSNPEACICGQVFRKEANAQNFNGYGVFNVVAAMDDTPLDHTVSPTLLSEGREWLESYALAQGFRAGDLHIFTESASARLGFESIATTSYLELTECWTDLIKMRHDTGALSG
jgi:hypothetical protein